VVEIRNARKQDLRAIARVLADAFDDSPIVEWIVPSRRLRPIALRAFFGSGARDAFRNGRVWVADDGGRIVGAAVWLPPGSYPMRTARELRTSFPILKLFPIAPRPLARALQYQAAVARVHTRDEHWYLVSIGVDQGLRGSGLGTRLLAPGLAAADDEGLPCYLETEKARNLPFYGRHRFDVTQHLPEPVADAPQVWCMTRPAD
jgi:GNAT superfamily N-acetyltransferase